VKRIVISIATGLTVAIAFLVIAFFAGVYVSESIWYGVSFPRAQLKALADHLLVPSGSEVLLRSGRQGVHHLFAGLCIAAVWTPVFTLLVWWWQRDRPPHP
jgi:hypothetical protein